MPDQAARVHAVLWSADGPPAALVDALARQGIVSEHARGPLDALARVFAARRGGVKPRVLLLVEPDRLPDAEQIRAAIDRFDPETGCWAYRAAASPKLSPLPAPARSPEPEVVVPPARNGSPELRLAGGNGAKPPETRAGRPDSGETEREPESPRSLLTPEELAMLLADEPQ